MSLSPQRPLCFLKVSAPLATAGRKGAGVDGGEGEGKQTRGDRVMVRDGKEKGKGCEGEREGMLLRRMLAS